MHDACDCEPEFDDGDIADAYEALANEILSAIRGERDEARQIARWLLAWARDRDCGVRRAWDAMPEWLQDAILEN